jgi:hypothetical protein
LIQLTKSGIAFDGANEDLASLRAEFDARHIIRLPRFVEPMLLKKMQEKLDESPFERFDREIGNEQRPADTVAAFTLLMLLNSARLFELVRRATGCGHIVCFSGRIYRRLPEPDYHHLWHDDMTDGGRMLALSINLSREVYGGGALQLRDAESKEILREEFNTGFGDAILFRIDRRLQHRITVVEGEFPKTALAGWFKSKP